MNFNLSDHTSYKAYFLAIATSNKQLGANQFLFGDVQVGQSEAADWKGKKLWAWPSVRAPFGGEYDNLFLRREGSIWLGGPCDSEKFADEDAWYQACENVMKQVVSKIIYDRQQDVISTNFNSYTLQRSDMTLSGTNFIGCELLFNWDDPTDLDYDANDWN